MSRCRKILAAVWFSGAAVLFGLLYLQSLTSRYGAREDEAWTWLIAPPTAALSLVVGVLVADAAVRSRSMRTDRFFFRLTLAVSVAFLLALLLVFLSPLFADASPLEIMARTRKWLAAFQGIVTAALGAFFVRAAPSA